MTIARNDKTKQLDRDNRFLIDDPESSFMLAYSLTKPLKLGWSYNNHGVYKFVLQEVTTTDDDNQELRIADYYKHFPRSGATPGSGNNGNSSGDSQSGGASSPGGETSGNENAGGGASDGEERTVWL